MTSPRSETCRTRIDKNCLAVGRLGLGRIFVVCGYMYMRSYTSQLFRRIVVVRTASAGEKDMDPLPHTRT